MNQPIKILSIDGGGIRGIIPAIILAEIEKRTGRPTADLFDLVAGTSTGGILALGLTKAGPDCRPEFSAEKLIDLYEKEGKNIFSRPFWRSLLSLDRFVGKKYPSDGIAKVADQYFGKARLKNALKDVIITSYEIEQRVAWFFKSRKAKVDPQYDFNIKDIALATAAAPTYFEPHKVIPDTLPGYLAFVDGGVFANNPAMCAYAEAKATHPEAQEFILVSLGTGTRTEPLPYNRAKKFGMAQWAVPILDVIFDGVADTVDYQVTQLPLKYYRFQTPINKENGEMDDTSSKNIEALKEFARKIIVEQNDLLNDLCRQLTHDQIK
ncbi:MAG: CBASS cGAMP-activated phospholipase [Candidatus Margulisiibacteriota bacterium]